MAEILAKHSKRLPVEQTPKAELCSQPPLAHEMWFAKRLGQHGVDIFTGDTDCIVRRERFRKAIKDAGLACAMIGRNKKGEPENYGACFARLYGESL